MELYNKSQVSGSNKSGVCNLGLCLTSTCCSSVPLGFPGWAALGWEALDWEALGWEAGPLDERLGFSGSAGLSESLPLNRMAGCFGFSFCLVVLERTEAAGGSGRERAGAVEAEELEPWNDLFELCLATTSR